jgi:hypothetical protein
MFIKKSFVDEIAQSIEQLLVEGAVDVQTEQQARIVKAADYLNSAAEIFDESGLTAQAELVTAVLESLAAKKSKKKKVKNKTRKPAAAKSESDQMVVNLKELGWMFDQPEEHDENCAACGDISYSDDQMTKLWWRIERKGEPHAFFNFEGTRQEAEERKQRREEYFGGEFIIRGPYNSVKDLERKHHPQWFEDDQMAADDETEDKLYSMLENFKRDTEDMDFEDELDFNDFDSRGPNRNI